MAKTLFSVRPYIFLFACLIIFHNYSYAADCYTAWSSSTQYGPGTSCGGGTPYRVSYGGRNYTARYCNKGKNPASNSQPGWGLWIDNGTCTSCSNGTANAGGNVSSICQGSQSASMGGSIGGGATAGTWSGGSGSWSNASSPSSAKYTASSSESGSITLTLTATGGCSTVTKTKTITVNANPTVSAGGGLSSICQSSQSASMGGAVGGGATGGTWSGGSGSWSSASSPSSARYTAGASESGSVTLTLTSSGGSCGTTSKTKNITVKANPTVSAGGVLSDICQSSTSLVMGGSVGGEATGGTWSGGSGTWTNATNPTTATYTADASELGTITLTLTTSGGSCGTTSTTKTITVNGPEVSVGSGLSSICQEATSSIMGGSVGGTATGGTWSGGAGSWTNASNPSTATYTASDSESGSITLTLTSSGGSCGTTSATKILTVNTEPTASAGGALSNVCKSGMSEAMGGSVGGAATGGTWSGGAGSWTNASNPSTATYTAGASESGVVTLTLTTTGGSCGSTNVTKTITVSADNTAGAASSTPSVCNNTALANITHSTTGATGISNDGVAGANNLPAGVSATWSGNTITISGIPTAIGTYSYSIPLTGGCGSVNATGTITVTSPLNPGVIKFD